MRIVGLFATAAFVAALGAVPALAQSRRDLSGLASAAASKGSVRVIVEFNAPSTAAALDTDRTGRVNAAHVTALRATQNAILGSALAAAAVERAAPVLMDVVPMLAVTVTADQLTRLAADPKVVRIHEDKLDKPSLIQSTGLIKMTGATGAWAKGAIGTNRIVAVLDTGVNRNHEFLKFGPTSVKVVAEACFNTTDATWGSITRCPRGLPASYAVGSAADCTAYDGCGHGTHVAGIAAGLNTSPSSGEPTKGVSYNSAILAINVFSRFDHTHPMMACGGGATADCLLSYTSDQIKGLERVYALRNGIGTRKIDAVNMSLGGGYYSGYCDSDPRRPIIAKLRAVGIATVVAAGNEYFSDGVGAPGCISSATTVGATSKSSSGNPEKVASYSNVGPQVDVFAPGGDYPYPSALGNAALIKSSYKGSNATYAYLGGTSMAAPHVAGAFAAIRSKASCAKKTVTEIESAMKTTGLSITDDRWGTGITRKRIDVAAVIAKLCP